VALDDTYHAKSVACDRQSDAQLETFAECQDREALPPVSRPRRRTRHRPHVDVRGALHRITGVDVTAMAGIDAPTALTSISEVGRDLGRWPTVKPVTAWLGRGPPHRVSGGKV
jgi:hypothetical protein